MPQSIEELRAQLNAARNGRESVRQPCRQADYEQDMEVILHESGAAFMQIKFEHVRHLKGDTAAAVMLAFFLNLLRMKHASEHDSRLLVHNAMWFRCPVKHILQQLGVTKRRQQSSIKRLVANDLVETERRNGNVLWVRVNTRALLDIRRKSAEGKGVGDHEDSDCRKAANRLPESGNPDCRKAAIPQGTKNPAKNLVSQADANTQPEANGSVASSRRAGPSGGGQEVPGSRSAAAQGNGKNAGLPRRAPAVQECSNGTAGAGGARPPSNGHENAGADGGARPGPDGGSAHAGVNGAPPPSNGKGQAGAHDARAPRRRVNATAFADGHVDRTFAYPTTRRFVEEMRRLRGKRYQSPSAAEFADWAADCEGLVLDCMECDGMDRAGAEREVARLLELHYANYEQEYWPKAATMRTLRAGFQKLQDADKRLRRDEARRHKAQYDTSDVFSGPTRILSEEEQW